MNYFTSQVNVQQSSHRGKNVPVIYLYKTRYSSFVLTMIPPALQIKIEYGR